MPDVSFVPKKVLSKNFLYRCSSTIVKGFLSLLRSLPSWVIRSLGRLLGSIIYSIHAPYRKRTLSNLFCCPALANRSPEELRSIAKKSLQRLAITMLEYGRLKALPIEKIAYCENPEQAEKIIQSGKGVIFFCGHLSNWEVLFLEGTSRMPGIAIGRPISNHYIYRYIVSIRERFGGKVVEPKNALKECLRALREGKFVGIVGDQGLPESEYKGHFLGRMAYTSNAPALLSIKTKTPVMVATVRFDGKRYAIHYGDPIYPPENLDDPKEAQKLMMDEMMRQFENKILEHPEDWLWSHNRWKLHIRGSINDSFRFDSILLTLPEESIDWSERVEKLYLLRRFFPHQVFGVQISKKDPLLTTLLCPEDPSSLFQGIHVLSYENETELFSTDPRFKLHLDASSNAQLQRHFLKKSSFKTLDIKEMFLLPLDQFRKQLEETLHAT